MIVFSLQRGSLDVIVHFSDGNSIQLLNFPPSYYQFGVEGSNTSIVVASSGSLLFVPGSGLMERMTNFSLHQNKICRRPTSRCLTSATVFINVTVAAETLTENTATVVPPFSKNSNMTWTSDESDENFEVFEDDMEMSGSKEDAKSNKKEMSISSKLSKMTKEKLLEDKLDDDVGNNAGDYERNTVDENDSFTFEEDDQFNLDDHEEGTNALADDEYDNPALAQKQPDDDDDNSKVDDVESVTVSNGRMSLQTALYILVIVFGIASILFFGNCVLFVMRCGPRSFILKRDGSKRPIVSPAEEWVWLSPETLEKNSVHIDCKRQLMGDDEFQGRISSHSSLRVPHTHACSNIGCAEESSRSSSGVSTYRGSQCSVRITANPLLATSVDISGEDVDVEERVSASDDELPTERDLLSRSSVGEAVDDEHRESCSEGPKMQIEDEEKSADNHRQLMAYFESLKESVA